MKSENCKKLTADGNVKLYMVEYHHEEDADSPHNQYFFETYEAAQRKYMHLFLDQITEKTLIRVIRFRAYNAYHGKYITIFESRVHHPVALYDNDVVHYYAKGKVPVSPRVEWRGGELLDKDKRRETE